MNTPSLIQTPRPEAPREGTGLWVYKIFAGLMIVVLLLVHYIVNHLAASPGGLLTYADVVAYYSNPLIRVMEVTFLAFVTSHALVGLRSIIVDLNPSDRALRLVDRGLVALGTVMIVYGTWLVIVVASRG